MPKNFAGKKKSINFAAQLREQGFQPSLRIALDSLAQLVEHNTFNVGVVGSSPTRITKVFGRILQNTATGSVAVFFLYVQTASECTLCDTRVGKSWANNPWAFLPTIENPDTLLSRYYNFRDEFPHL